MAKILVVEDDSFLQGLEVGKLKKEGYDVITASTGKEALEKIKEDDIDLILLDLVLPNFDGFEVLKEIRENEKTKKTPVLVFSNLSEEKDIKRAEDLKANDFMVKSNFTIDELAQKIKAMLG